MGREGEVDSTRTFREAESLRPCPCAPSCYNCTEARRAVKAWEEKRRANEVGNEEKLSPGW